MEFLTLLAPFDKDLEHQDHYEDLKKSLRSAVNDLISDENEGTFGAICKAVDAVQQYLDGVREFALKVGANDITPVPLTEYPFEGALADTLDGIVLTKKNVKDEVLADTRNDLMIALFYQAVDIYIQYHLRNSRVVGYFHGA